MVTTNLPQFVSELSMLGTVQVHDTQDRIELTISGPTSMADVDDLVCDALFVDPVLRRQAGQRWIIHFNKRNVLRGAADLGLKRKASTFWYQLRPTA